MHATIPPTQSPPKTLPNGVELRYVGQNELTHREWLRLRRKYIGASEAYAAGRMCPDLWAEKKGHVERKPASIAMRRGLALESLIANLYAEETGNAITERQVFLWHDGYGTCATLDAVDSTDAPVEFKSLHERNKRDFVHAGGDDWEIPDRYYVQVQAQLALHGSSAGWLAVLFSDDDFMAIPVWRDQRIIDSLYRQIARFRSYLAGDVPPPGPIADTSWLGRVYPPRPETIEATDHVAKLAEKYRSLGKTIAECETERQIAKCDLIRALEGRSAVTPDGYEVGTKTVVRKGYEVKPAEFLQIYCKERKGA